MKILTRILEIPKTAQNALHNDTFQDIQYTLKRTFFDGHTWAITRFIPHGGEIGDEYVETEIFNTSEQCWKYISEEFLAKAISAIVSKGDPSQPIPFQFRIQNQEAPFKGAKLTFICGPIFTHGVILSMVSTRLSYQSKNTPRLVK